MLGLNTVEDFKKAHAESREPLEQFVGLLKSISPKHLLELKHTFGPADYVPPFTVFDVKGNKIRVIGTVSYKLQVVTLTHVLPHAEYDKGGWKK